MLIQNIKVAADAVVFSTSGEHLQVVLVKRKYDPFKGMWAIPGGFVEDDEELEDAAIRELHEETGMKLTSMKQLQTFGKVGRDPRGRTVSVTYGAIVDAKDHPVTGGDDAAEAHWVNVKDITEMAFDHMDELRSALQAFSLI